jgi:metal-responsive CopG/Arc/MetJ family transcriptional regulator
MPKQVLSLWLDEKIIQRIDSVKGVSSRSAVMNEFLSDRLLESNPHEKKAGDMP